MPVSVSQHLGVDPKKLSKLGVFDAILDVDTRLFIDPALLESSSAPEFREARLTIDAHFEDVLTLIRSSKREGDKMWREASKRLTFPEVQGLCLGYSKSGTSGSGMGEGLRNQLLRTASEIVDAGIVDPRVFELAGLLEEGIGADRISDMIAGIIRSHIADYTERMTGVLGFQTLPENPFNGAPIQLVPMDVLRSLPVADDWDDIDLVCAENELLRRELNEHIGDTWKRATNRRKVAKAELRATLMRNPEAMRDLVGQYREKDKPPYDLRRDQEGLYSWLREGNRLADTFPLDLGSIGANLDNVVRSICNHFKDMIENKGCEKSLYQRGKDGKPMHESYAQRLFFAMADAYCKANNLDITPEADSGQGPVDFKFSEGYEARVIVEVKLSTNGKLADGYTKQVSAYQLAENKAKAVYLVIDLGLGDADEKKIEELRKRMRAEPKKNRTVVFVDASRKASASKR